MGSSVELSGYRGDEHQLSPHQNANHYANQHANQHANQRADQRADHRQELLSVRIGAQEFAMDIRSIREIRGWIASTHLPHAPSFIKGMINLRGTVLVVIDLSERLGLAAVEPNAASVVVVVEHGDKVAGLLVDAVCDIITVTDDMRQGTPETGSSAPREFIEGLVMMENRIISIVAIAALMPESSIQALADAA